MAQKQKEFSMPLSQQAYEEYYKALELGDKILQEQKAIGLLSRVCDEYLNRLDGDFIKIEMSNKFQR